MEKVQLIMVVHCHQPVGNFDTVFEQAVERCYAPFLEALARHPGVRLGLHYSGSLIEWLEEHQPTFLDKIGKLYERGQVELLGGGFYEPMLAVLPESDALGQIEMMREYLNQRFGAKPEGIWLTERVWEPELSSLLFRADARYTLVDDTHFYYAGMKPERLYGYYVTEKAGETVAIFAIDKVLRYSIPFKPVEVVMDELRKAAGTGPRGLVYGDDGEKFGVWPGTYEWVYEKGWLEDFFTVLEQSDFIELLTPADYLKRHRLSGRVYLPTASYEEMQTWAMPAEAIGRYEDLKRKLQQVGLAEKAEPFIRGGLWQNFMSKYTEANHLHKKMLVVSRKLAEASEEEGSRTEEHEEARRELYRGQCNCAYWHGLFGGLYLPHLRDAVFRHLIAAENILDRQAQGDEDWIAYDEHDIDGDSEEEVIVENALMNVYFDPGEGGAIIELDYRPIAFNLTNTLTRRKEGYHRLLQSAAQTSLPEASYPGAPLSIHEINRANDPSLLEKVVVDNSPRCCFIDRFPAPGTRLEDLQRASYVEEGDFLGARYHVERIGIDEAGECDFRALLTRKGYLVRQGKTFPVILEKQLAVPADQSEIQITYTLRNPEANAIDLVFCPELNLSLLAGNDEKCVYQFEGMSDDEPTMGTSGELEDVSWFDLVDRRQSFRVGLEFEPPVTLWRHPVETISQSESGIEQTFQGSAIIPRVEITIPPQASYKFSIRLKCQPLDEGSEVSDSLE